MPSIERPKLFEFIVYSKSLTLCYRGKLLNEPTLFCCLIRYYGITIQFISSMEQRSKRGTSYIHRVVENKGNERIIQLEGTLEISYSSPILCKLTTHFLLGLCVKI